MFSRFLKKKEEKKVWKETEEVVAPKEVYKPLEWSRTDIEGGVEYEIKVTDSDTGRAPYWLKSYKIKITHVVSVSYKKLVLKTNQVKYSNLESIPCLGFEKMTLGFTCKQINHWYEGIFDFKFWHGESAEGAEEKEADISWSSGYIYSLEYIEGLEEVLYQIQVDIQEAIERTNE